MGRCIAKTAALTCACGNRFEAVVTESGGWGSRCTRPRCGRMVREKPVAVNQAPAADRRFFGEQRVSIREGFHPSEVTKARRLFDGVPVEITNGGDVCVDSRSDMNAYYRRKREIRERVAEARGGG